MRADAMLNGLVFAGVGLATHYHTVDVYPWWSPRLEKIAQQGSHLFFRWPGYWGSARVVTNRVVPEPSAALFAALDPAVAQPIETAGTDLGLSVGRQDLPASPGPVPVKGYAEANVGAGESAALVPTSRRLEAAAKPNSRPIDAAIGTPALLGNRVLRMFPEDSVFYLQVVPGSKDATRRQVAEMLCGGRPQCRVYGWTDAQSAPATSQADPRSIARPDFTFIRKPPSLGQPTPSTVTAF
jgi:hypothetical protein